MRTTPPASRPARKAIRQSTAFFLGSTNPPAIPLMLAILPLKRSIAEALRPIKIPPMRDAAGVRCCEATRSQFRDICFTCNSSNSRQRRVEIVGGIRRSRAQLTEQGISVGMWVATHAPMTLSIIRQPSSPILACNASSTQNVFDELQFIAHEPRQQELFANLLFPCLAECFAFFYILK